MTSTQAGSNYSIQSNGYGPGHSSHKSKRHKFQPRGEAQVEDTKPSTSSQRLATTIETLIDSPEAKITSITVVRPESFPTGHNRDIHFSVKELVYGSKATGVGTSANSLDRHNEL
ncbi:hypothetical protein O181_077910 [Austropuccinia psidii MF-1]|uniref:Uncharacterized protein n=1 Tax=Austropuccinia psidii MF-1 TaxID=1389203 RepID=A0A9Q3IGF7_9BASI|nr:hypothetical protein [Austropuccinia psidii MF-1]